MLKKVQTTMRLRGTYLWLYLEVRDGLLFRKSLLVIRSERTLELGLKTDI